MREQVVLRMRLEGKTLEEIGKEFYVTRERIRQVLKRSCGSTFSTFSKSMRKFKVQNDRTEV